jgi:hypothetical protein
MIYYRKQKPTESDAEYELYREERRLVRSAQSKAYRDSHKEQLREAKNVYREANRELLKDKSKAYREANKGQMKDWSKSHRLKSRYGLTLDEYNTLIEKGCNVCGTTENLCVDHCHETLKVRGCLCNKCNSALGFLREDPVIIQQLLNYVEVHQNES